MTTDLALNALKAWIEYNHAAKPALEDIPIHLRDTEEEQPGLCIVLKETGSEEHPVLRGVLLMGIDCMLVSVPGDEEDDANPSADHQALVADLYNVLADTAGIDFLSTFSGFKCFDIRGTAPISEQENGLRITRFEMRIVGCPV
jgi:hypothetical protein